MFSCKKKRRSRKQNYGAAKKRRCGKDTTASQIHYDIAENYEVVKKLLCTKKYEAIKKGKKCGAVKTRQ